MVILPIIMLFILFFMPLYNIHFLLVIGVAGVAGYLAYVFYNYEYKKFVRTVENYNSDPDAVFYEIQVRDLITYYGNKGEYSYDAEKKPCIYCKEPVNEEATKCPHCRGKLDYDFYGLTKKKRLALFFSQNSEDLPGIFIFLIIIIPIASFIKDVYIGIIQVLFLYFVFYRGALYLFIDDAYREICNVSADYPFKRGLKASYLAEMEEASKRRGRRWNIFLVLLIALGALMYFTNPDETDFKSHYAAMNYIPYDNIISVDLEEFEGLNENNPKIQRMKEDFEDKLSSGQEEVRFAILGRKNLYVGSVFAGAHFIMDEAKKEPDAESVMYIGLFNQFIKISEE